MLDLIELGELLWALGARLDALALASLTAGIQDAEASRRAD